jgi:GNAT superfamily N-acetyltransferase
MNGSLLVLRPSRLAELPYAFSIDDDAGEMFNEIGISFGIPDAHPFVVAEHERWRLAVARGDLWFALSDDVPVGFLVLGRRDGLAYLDQLSVRTAYGRRGIGRTLLEKACEVCRGRGDTEVWLTTYDHVPWNRPFYERAGFVRVSVDACGTEICAILAEQRAALPAPEQRVAMRRVFSRAADG